MTPLTTGIASIAQMGSTLINSLQAKRNTDLTIKANKELADYQYQKNLESWHLQNAYNTPEAQMQRYKEAGLNPNLIYGQGNSGNAQAISSYQAPKVDYQYKSPVDPMEMINTFFSFRKNMADVQTAEANAKHAEQLAKGKADIAYYKSYGEDYRTRQQALISSMMANDYVLNTNNAPTPWQSFQMEAMRLANEAKSKEVKAIEQRTAESDQRTQLIKKEVDNFLLKMWSGIGLNTANTILKFK